MAEAVEKVTQPAPPVTQKVTEKATKALPAPVAEAVPAPVDVPSAGSLAVELPG